MRCTFCPSIAHCFRSQRKTLAATPAQAWPADQRFSVSSRLKTFHGPLPGSACSISFACAQSVQTETSSKATAIALACGHGLALYSLGHCIAMASTTFLIPVARMIVDKAYTEPGTWLSAEIVGHWASLANCRNVPSGSCGRRKHGHWPLELRVLCAGLLSDCIWRIPAWHSKASAHTISPPRGAPPGHPSR